MCQCFIMFLLGTVYIWNWMHYAQYVSSPPSTLKDFVIKNEPKHCTDRRVNARLHAVFRSCCVSKEAQCQRKLSCACQQAALGL